MCLKLAISHSIKTQKSIFDTIGVHITSNDGWEEVDSETKEQKGIVPSKLEANLQMSFKNLTIPVEKLNLMVMPSYRNNGQEARLRSVQQIFEMGNKLQNKV